MPPPMPEVPPGEAVNLKLPPWKTVHVDYYRGLVEGRLLWHSRGRGGERNTKQIGKWERDTRQVIHPEVLSDGREMGLPRRQILRPAWTRELDLEPTEVDHIVEYQLRPLTNSAFIDEAWNFELLDEASNNASGNRLKQNIIDERRRLAARTADMLWLVCDIQFTRLQLEGLAPAGRWQRDEVARGDHLREFKRRKLDPTKYGGTRPASATEDEQ